MDDVLRALTKVLYDQPLEPARMSITDILTGLPGMLGESIEEAIQMLSDKHILRISFQRDYVHQTTFGKLIYAKDCVAELCLGNRYIAEKHRGSVLHISVQDAEGDAGSGTGFFCADFPGWIATARHVVESKTITNIEDESGKSYTPKTIEIRYTADDLDLALLRCDAPKESRPLRIEWDPKAVQELDEVLVVGFPPISQHLPALALSEGSVISIASRQRGTRKSIIISRITEPGYSGGPVISASGRVIGVVEQENEFTRKDGSKSIFIGATPSHYFSEFK